ncbi:MAG TPA: hypothetical protein DCK95_01775 [Anaerolineaceae bacterium]|nr:hypothetical protein [Anaerolineaceae bacterium]
MKWFTIILGALLFLAPFFSGYSGQAGLLWFSLIGGVLLVVFGSMESYKWVGWIGLIVFLAPWIFGFGGTNAATWSWIIGAVTGLVGLYKGWLEKSEA